MITTMTGSWAHPLPMGAWRNSGWSTFCANNDMTMWYRDVQEENCIDKRSKLLNKYQGHAPVRDTGHHKFKYNGCFCFVCCCYISHHIFVIRLHCVAVHSLSSQIVGQSIRTLTFTEYWKHQDDGDDDEVHSLAAAHTGFKKGKLFFQIWAPLGPFGTRGVRGRSPRGRPGPSPGFTRKGQGPWGSGAQPPRGSGASPVPILPWASCVIPPLEKSFQVNMSSWQQISQGGSNKFWTCLPPKPTSFRSCLHHNNQNYGYVLPKNEIRCNTKPLYIDSGLRASNGMSHPGLKKIDGMVMVVVMVMVMMMVMMMVTMMMNILPIWENSFLGTWAQALGPGAQEGPGPWPFHVGLGGAPGPLSGCTPNPRWVHLGPGPLAPG